MSKALNVLNYDRIIFIISFYTLCKYIIEHYRSATQKLLFAKHKWTLMEFIIFCDFTFYLFENTSLHDLIYRKK